MLCGKKGEGVDDAMRERMEVLTRVTDLEVRAREILADVMEFLHAELQARIDITIRTRGMSPPYTIDGGEYADPQYVTVRMRTESTQIANAMQFMFQYRWYGIEYLRVALLQCNGALTLFASKFDGWGGLTLRSTYFGQPRTAVVWIEAMRMLISITVGDISRRISEDQERDTLPPEAMDPDPKPEDT